MFNEEGKQVVKAINLLFISIFLFPLSLSLSLSLSISYHSVLEVRLSSNSATIKPTFLTYLQKINWNKIHNDDEGSSGLCGVGLLNDSGCRSRTQGRRLRDVEGSMASGCCGSGSNVENGVTSIGTRQLRKYQDNGFIPC